jgi:hypothetical protein
MVTQRTARQTRHSDRHGLAWRRHIRQRGQGTREPAPASRPSQLWQQACTYLALQEEHHAVGPVGGWPHDGHLQGCPISVSQIEILTDDVRLLSGNAEWSYKQIPMFGAGPSGRAVWGVGTDRLDAETVGSNHTKRMDGCPHLFISIIHLSF